jgi:hypothetical protein
VFCGALAGAGLGFLWFNAYPAEVFMGDVGALALGAALGAVAVVARQEIVLFIMGGVFVAETLSVMLQVGWFKATGGRRRILRMAPLHHHFELTGWKETQVVVRFWIITILLVLFGLVDAETAMMNWKANTSSSSASANRAWPARAGARGRARGCAWPIRAPRRPTWTSCVAVSPAPTLTRASSTRRCWTAPTCWCSRRGFRAN